MRAVSESGFKLFRRSPSSPEQRAEDLAIILMSRRGEASGTAIAQMLLDAYVRANTEDRLSFLAFVADKLGPDLDSVKAAVESFAREIDQKAAMRLHSIAEPKRQELFRRLNAAPGATGALVKMREDVLDNIKSCENFDLVNQDLLHLFSSWFNRGFLIMQAVNWETPANILSKIIKYEAVHEIRDWEDLRGRLEPADRRCFAFFHPQLGSEPLIFVEVAIARETPSAIAPLLDVNRARIAPESATTAVFYSISNTQRGLAGVSFGNFLIKQVVDDLKRELPNIETFVTLSPVVGFARWLADARKNENSNVLSIYQRQMLSILDEADWHQDTDRAEAVRSVLVTAAARYLLTVDGKGRPLDAVARFHLGNGARLDRINFLADCSAKGLRQSHGIMVNYLYDPETIEKNHEAFAGSGVIAASPNVTGLVSAGQLLPI